MNKGIIFENNELSDLLCGNMHLNEAYFGKTKELLAAEQQLDKFRNKYMGKYIMNTRVNSDPDLLEFDRMMEKIFGFGCLTVQITNVDQANAFTMPIDYNWDYNNSNNIIADERGFKFKPECDYATFLCINSGLIFNPEFSTPEIMSILLHEIGHNFNSSINKPNGVLVRFYVTILYIINLLSLDSNKIINVITSNNRIRKFIGKTEKELRSNNSMIMIVSDVIDQVGNLIDTYKNNINSLYRIFSLGMLTNRSAIFSIINKLIHPVNLILSPFITKVHYTSEESADNFVTMYGYGGELSSALSKLRYKEGTSSSIVMGAFDNIPIISTIMHLNEMPAFLIMSFMGAHPNDISRVKDQMELLKHELDKEDLDPKMAHYIKSDIKVCEEALDALIDCSKGINDPYIGEKFYNRIVNHSKDTKRKMYGNKHKFEEYDKVFKKASK